MDKKDHEKTSLALDLALAGAKIQQAAIFNTLRILKRINPGDMYYEAYLGHLQRAGEDFYDMYMLLWEIAVRMKPKRILEVGTRTGISLCQLLSGYIDLSVVEKIVCVDPFDDDYLSPGLVRRNLEYLNLPVGLVEFMQTSSEFALPELAAAGDKYDYILVDGDHAKEAAARDLEWADKLCADDGVIVFDDISDAPGECALIDVWRAFEEKHQGSYEFVHNMTGKGVAWAVRV